MLNDQDQSLARDTNVFYILSILSVKGTSKSVYTMGWLWRNTWYSLVEVEVGKSMDDFQKIATYEQHLKENRIWVKKV